MTKILYLTDIHLKGLSPKNRTDDYKLAIFEKIKEALTIAKSEKCTLIICGGDVFDSELLANTITDEFVDLVESFNIPFYTTGGNHDLRMGNWEVSKATSLAHVFRRSKLIKHLDEIDLIDVYIKGQDYYVGIEEDLNKSFPQHDKKDKLTIYVPHAMLVDVPVWYTSSVNMDEVKTNYDYVLVSHNHKYIGIKGKFIAPGAIARINADEFDMDRHPSVVIIDVETKKVEIIKLKSAKDIFDIFDLEKLEEQKTSKQALEAFTDGLKNSKIQTLKVMDVVMSVCQDSNVDENVRTDLREKIGMNGG